MKIQGLIFDMDGTLIDSMIFWDMFWPEIGKRCLGDESFLPDEATQKAIRTLPLGAAMKLLHETCGIGENAEVLFDTANALCVDFYRDTVKMKDGALAFLEHCRKSGIRMCVASATASELLEIVMQKFDLGRYFPRVISCNEVGVGKNHPDVFLLAREYLGTPMESTWVVEDSVTAVETANRAGFPTVGIYDCHNFDLDYMEAISTEFIGAGETLEKLIPKMQA